MSYLKQVMEMLGLEDMQEFEVNEMDYGYVCRFNLKRNEFEYTLPSLTGWEGGVSMLKNIITGRYTIKREWKPKFGEEYFVAVFDNEELWDYIIWVGSKWQKPLLQRGLVFKTKEEAIECAEKMLEAIK